MQRSLRLAQRNAYLLNGEKRPDFNLRNDMEFERFRVAFNEQLQM